MGAGGGRGGRPAGGGRARGGGGGVTRRAGRAISCHLHEARAHTSGIEGSVNPVAETAVPTRPGMSHQKTGGARDRRDAASAPGGSSTQKVCSAGLGPGGAAVG